MNEIPFPIISAEEYDAFFRLTNGNLPDTHNEWLNIHTKRQLERKKQGAEVVNVEVHPNEFAAFCKAHNVAPSLKSLGDFALHHFRTQSK